MSDLQVLLLCIGSLMIILPQLYVLFQLIEIWRGNNHE